MLKWLKIGVVFGAIALSLLFTNGKSPMALHQNVPLGANETPTYYFVSIASYACIVPLNESIQLSVQTSPFPNVSKFIQGFTAVFQSKKPKWISIIHVHWTHPIVSIFYKDILYPFHFFF
jgi:hypothetical protein